MWDQLQYDWESFLNQSLFKQKWWHVILHDQKFCVCTITPLPPAYNADVEIMIKVLIIHILTCLQCIWNILKFPRHTILLATNKDRAYELEILRHQWRFSQVYIAQVLIWSLPWKVTDFVVLSVFFFTPSYWTTFNIVPFMCQ